MKNRAYHSLYKEQVIKPRKIVYMKSVLEIMQHKVDRFLLFAEISLACS